MILVGLAVPLLIAHKTFRYISNLDLRPVTGRRQTLFLIEILFKDYELSNQLKLNFNHMLKTLYIYIIFSKFNMMKDVCLNLRARIFESIKLIIKKFIFINNHMNY